LWQYETFEKDPVKYARYEEAVAAALADTPTDKQSVIMVVGAGRGQPRADIPTQTPVGLTRSAPCAV
jgi:hypothetical protein